jgi:hypothetical protein
MLKAASSRPYCRQSNERERRLIGFRPQGDKTEEAADLLGGNAEITRVRLSRLRRKLRRSGVFADWQRASGGPSGI